MNYISSISRNNEKAMDQKSSFFFCDLQAIHPLWESFWVLYFDSEQVNFQYNSQSQLQEEDPCYNQEPPLARWLDMSSKVVCHKGRRHEPGHTSNNPSENLQGNNGEALRPHNT